MGKEIHLIVLRIIISAFYRTCFNITNNKLTRDNKAYDSPSLPKPKFNFPNKIKLIINKNNADLSKSVP